MTTVEYLIGIFVRLYQSNSHMAFHNIFAGPRWKWRDRLRRSVWIPPSEYLKPHVRRVLYSLNLYGIT